MTTATRLGCLALGTIASAVLIGCASVDAKGGGGAWRIEPLVELRHGGDAANGRAYFALGQAYQGEGRWQEAAEAYSKAAFADPDSAEAFHSLGIAQAVLGRHAGAITAFRHAVDLDPESAQYLNNLGYALLLSGQYARSLPFLRAALAREPGHEQARTNIARVEIMLRPVAAAPAVEAASPAPDLAAAEPGPTSRAAETPPDPALADRLAGFRIEIANGNGVRGAAARLREWLRERGVDTARLSNLRPFTSADTQVEYQPGHLAQALEIARRMPDGAGVVPAADSFSRADVRVVIGHDVKAAAASCRGRWPCPRETAGTQTADAAPRAAAH